MEIKSDRQLLNARFAAENWCAETANSANFMDVRIIKRPDVGLLEKPNKNGKPPAKAKIKQKSTLIWFSVLFVLLDFRHEKYIYAVILQNVYYFLANSYILQSLLKFVEFCRKLQNLSNFVEKYTKQKRTLVGSFFVVSEMVHSKKIGTKFCLINARRTYITM